MRHKEKLAHWKRHFEGVGCGECFRRGGDCKRGKPLHIRLSCTRAEVEKAVGKLKNGKAAGGDEVVAKLVKNGGQAMIDCL